ncbi:MAG: ankyrin repeat domain-containing protein [Planctomycetota bacterium]
MEQDILADREQFDFLVKENRHQDVVMAKALAYGSFEDVESAIDSGGNPNARMDYGYITPLGIAAARCDAAKTRLLLERGARITDRERMTPIAYAALYGSQAVLKVYIDHGYSMTELEGFPFYSPLSSAVDGDHIDLVKWLIGLGADPNKRSPDGFLPIDGAIGRLNREMFDYLLPMLTPSRRRSAKKQWEVEEQNLKLRNERRG